jgi:hypothetical protein
MSSLPYKTFAAYPPLGNCLHVGPGEWTYEPGGSSGNRGDFELIVHNRSGKKGNVVIEAFQGNVESGYIEDGQDGGYTRPLTDFMALSGLQCKITRWAPGALGFMGNGGGEITFVVPSDAKSMRLELTIVS